MSEHDSIRNMLGLAAAEALDPPEMAGVERHAAVCPDCRRDLEAWRNMARGLSQLPQPAVPAFLLERTRARILSQREAAENHRLNAWTLSLLAVFGWLSSFTLWILLRVFSGGAITVFGANLADGLVWMLGWTVLTWMTAAIAAVVLGRARQTRRVL